eukprot:12203694-Alexandrium_andersonii.AAC.1
MHCCLGSSSVQRHGWKQVQARDSRNEGPAAPSTRQPSDDPEHRVRVKDCANVGVRRSPLLRTSNASSTSNVIPW